MHKPESAAYLEHKTPIAQPENNLAYEEEEEEVKTNCPSTPSNLYSCTSSTPQNKLHKCACNKMCIDA